MGLINFDRFTDTNNTRINLTDEEIDNLSSSDKPKKKRGRPKKEETGLVLTSQDKEDFTKPIPQTMSNEPYLGTYDNTTMLLRQSIDEINALNTAIGGELKKIMSSKTMKGKYQIISELTGTASSLINNKISAIREINNTISKSHDLDLKRLKELNAQKGEQDDDQALMKLYNAYISAPVGTYNMPQGIQQPPNDLIQYMANNNPNIITMMPADNSPDAMYQAYQQSLTPEENMMRLEKNPNVQTVVFYNKDTGDRYFDVIDITTGMSIPNTVKPSSLLLDSLDISIRNKIARNANTNQTFPLIVMGENNNIV